MRGGREHSAKLRPLSLYKLDDDDVDIDPPCDLPSFTDFLIAIGYIRR
jgi:hypothetical protein